MKLVMCVVRDNAIASFGNPMALQSEGQAIRSFTDEVNRSDPQNQIYMHPDDFLLFKLGTFDTDTGLFDCAMPEQIASGKSLKIR